MFFQQFLKFKKKKVGDDAADTCYDRGAPLIYRNGNALGLIGITLMGFCGASTHDGSGSFYTFTPYFVDWISTNNLNFRS